MITVSKDRLKYLGVIDRILVVRTDRIGEVLLSTPILTELRRAFPEASIGMLVRPEVKDLVMGNPHINEVIEYTQEKRGIHEALRIKKVLQRKRYDMIVIVNPQKEFHLAAFLAGVPVSVGFNRKWGFLLTHRVPDQKHLADRHEVDYNLDLVRVLGIEPKDSRPVLMVSPESDEGLFDLLKIKKDKQKEWAHHRLVAIHPCTSNPKKQWPHEYFARIADLLIRRKCDVVFVSGLQEVYDAKRVMSMMRHAAFDITGRLTLKQLASFLKRCTFLISSDSGPVHVAAAVGTPVVALFGRADAGSRSSRWGPYGRNHVVIEKDRLEDISPEEVLQAATEEFEL